MFLIHNTFLVSYIWNFLSPSLPISTTTSSRKTSLTTPVHSDFSQQWINFVLKTNTLMNLLQKILASSHDGGVGRYTSSHNQQMITPNLTTKNQNFQTTKELKKKHSSRLVERVETGNQVGGDMWQGSGWWTKQSHACIWINWGVRQTTQPRSPVWEKRASKPLVVKTYGGCGGGGRTCQSHSRVFWRGPWGPGAYTNLLTWESAPDGLNLLVGSGGSDWKSTESPASSIVPSLALPPHTVPQCSQVGCLALVNT